MGGLSVVMHEVPGANLSFEKVPSSFAIRNPFNAFKLEEHRVEVRKDPILGDTSVYNPVLRDKARAFFGETNADLVKSLVDESRNNCIFCGESVLRKTAQYPQDTVPEGRIRSGEALLFANLFSVAAYHPVIALGNRHFTKLTEFTPELFADGFRATQAFLHAVYSRDVSAAYAAVCANFLLPAGASLVHPHMQALITPVAYSYHARLKDASQAYSKKHGSSCFDDLVAEETRLGERFIKQTGNWNWLAAFSPMGTNEIMAIHTKESDLDLLADADIAELGRGITKVLFLYDALGHISFNFALYSVRSKKPGAEGFRCQFKIVSRQNLSPNYRNDDYFIQKMLQSELIFNLPEDLAERLRIVF